MVCTVWFLYFSDLTNTSGLGCYVCQSIDGSNPDCEDPFNATYVNSTRDYYNEDCYTGRKNRNGLFPSTACVKVKGKYSEYSFFGTEMLPAYDFRLEFHRGEKVAQEIT